MAEKKTYTLPEALRAVADLYSFRLEELRDKNRTTRAGLRALADELALPPEPTGDVLLEIVTRRGAGRSLIWGRNPNGTWGEYTGEWNDRRWKTLIEDFGPPTAIYRKEG